MVTFLITIHIIASLFLIVLVLLQSGKGADMGAAFGGSTNTLFGIRGAMTFLNKLTTAVAVIFMFTSLLLAIVITKTDSVIKNAPVPQSNTIPQQQLPQQPIQQPQGR